MVISHCPLPIPPPCYFCWYLYICFPTWWFRLRAGMWWCDRLIPGSTWSRRTFLCALHTLLLLTSLLSHRLNSPWHPLALTVNSRKDSHTEWRRILLLAPRLFRSKRPPPSIGCEHYLLPPSKTFALVFGLTLLCYSLFVELTLCMHLSQHHSITLIKNIFLLSYKYIYISVIFCSCLEICQHDFIFKCAHFKVKRAKKLVLKC